MIKPKQYDQTESRRPILELPSATVRLDVLSVQGAGKMTKSRKLDEGGIKVEGSGVVQNQTEIQASNMKSPKSNLSHNKASPRKLVHDTRIRRVTDLKLY
ncbi:hypothetical protein ACFXTN_013521 [Malus domestica]